ncbi:MAG: hypothetical protein A2048_05680 [Deltaproteobacteria bacterium GWA2_45_12]|nr:MAG: hypothetical protein A2048_05680 [Deltaproteobacteria bacterium GWA2_45_12]
MATQAILQLKSGEQKKNNLLLIVPYLSGTIVQMISSQKMSALDLNGNYYIQTPEFLAIRLDQENQYKDSQPIKKIFSGNSSLVGRLLLTQKGPFNSLREIGESIAKRGVGLSVSTISKVLTRLEEELIVQKEDNQIRLIQSDKLLDQFKEEYVPPKIEEIIKIMVPDPFSLLKEKFPTLAWSLTGESSAYRYTVTTPPKVFSVYVTDLINLDADPNERFPNLILKQTGELPVYFDRLKEDGLNFSSKLQSYLELSQLDKREKEIAQGIRDDILSNLK